MSIRTSLPLIASVVLLACGGGTPPAEKPTAPESSASAAAPTEAPSAGAPEKETKSDTPAEKPEAKPAEAAKAPKLDKPKSEASIGGKSVSELDDSALTGELKKLGWVKDGAAVAGGIVGSYQSLRVDIEKGKLKGHVEIVRPAAEPGTASSSGMTPPAEQKAERDKEGAATQLDEAADVLVIVKLDDGKPADAKKLLGQLVKVTHAKTAAKTAKPEAPPKSAPKPAPAPGKTAAKKK